MSMYGCLGAPFLWKGIEKERSHCIGVNDVRHRGRAAKGSKVRWLACLVEQHERDVRNSKMELVMGTHPTSITEE